MRYTFSVSAWFAGVLAAFIFSLAGCEDNAAGDNNNTNSSGRVELDELCEVIVDDLCLVLMQCYD